jgi:hypothetical protein
MVVMVVLAQPHQLQELRSLILVAVVVRHGIMVEQLVVLAAQVVVALVMLLVLALLVQQTLAVAAVQERLVQL